MGYPEFVTAGLGPLVGLLELDVVLRPDSVPPPMSAPAGIIDSSSSSLPELSGEELFALGPPAFAIPFLFDPFVPARDERRPRPVLAPGLWASVVAAAAGEDDISLHYSRGLQGGLF